MTPSRVFRSRWLLPIDRPPIAGGWVEVSAGRIASTGHGVPPAGAVDLGDVAILPGLVNAHTHLELSWLAGRVAPAVSMVDWIRALMAERAAGPAATGVSATEAVQAAAMTMRDTGTVLVGDVSNTLSSVPALRAAGLGGVLFHEIFGFNVADPAAAVREAWRRLDAAIDAASLHDPELLSSVVAHAPYSVAPALFAEIARRARSSPLTIHLAESRDELEFLQTGRGPFRQLLEDLRVWDPSWQVPACEPAAYLRRVGYWQRGLLAVHGVHLSDAGLDALKRVGATVVTCPRSNEWVGGGVPRLSHFYAAGIPVAIGTDSLASVSTLNLFDELAEMRRLAPEVAAASLLESATRVGAQALGFGRDYGTVAVGKRAALVGVDVPPDVSDVEEYLVGGIPSAAIRRLHH